MKTYEELARGALARAQKERSAKKKRNKIIALSLGIVFAVGAAVILARAIKPPVQLPSPETPPFVSQAGEATGTVPASLLPETVFSEVTALPPVSQEPSSVRHAAEPTLTEPVPESVTAPVTVLPSDGYAGGEETAPISNDGFVYTGEKISDAEAAVYFAENEGHIVGSLAASGVNTENARINDRGYCHMNLGAAPEVRLNFRDYLVYSGDTLIAILTLYKENGQLYCTPAFGGPWFADYAAFLEKHRGETLYYYYYGIQELILTPQNEVINPLGYEASPEAPDLSTLICPEIAYVP